MNYWILPSNEDKFRLSDLLKVSKLVDWKQHNNYEVGDVVFIYNSHPLHRILYMMSVERINVPSSEYINDHRFWNDESECEKGLKVNKYVRFRLLVFAPSSAKLTLDDLRKKGLKSSLQGAVKVTDTKLLYYIKCELQPETKEKVAGIYRNTTVVDSNSDSIIDPSNQIPEGAKLRVIVNRYERSQEVREKCLKAKGYSCSVCGMNFEKMYGSLGKGFIHVHHVVPISEIGESYIVDPVNDLVPVCPNCHAMLHRGADRVLSINELKKLIGK